MITWAMAQMNIDFLHPCAPRPSLCDPVIQSANCDSAWDTADPSIVPVPGAIVDNVARFSLDTGEVGYGLLEVMTMGPHVRYFTAWDDVA